METKTTQRLKLNAIAEHDIKLIPVRGSKVPAWPNDVKEIEIEDGEIYDVIDFYRIDRDEKMYPQSLVTLATGFEISQTEIWLKFRRENQIFFFVAKLRK